MKRLISLLLILALLCGIPAMGENAWSAKSHLKLDGQMIYDLLALLGMDSEGRLALDLSGAVEGDEGQAMLRLGKDALTASDGQNSYTLNYAGFLDAFTNGLTKRLDPQTLAAIGAVSMGIQYVKDGGAEADLKILASVLETEANRFASLTQQMGILTLSPAGDIHIEAAADDLLLLVKEYLNALIADDLPFAQIESTRLWELTGLKESGFTLKQPLEELKGKLKQITTLGTDAKLTLDLRASGTADALITGTIENVFCKLSASYNGRKAVLDVNLTDGNETATVTAYAENGRFGYAIDDTKIDDPDYRYERSLDVTAKNGVYSLDESSTTEITQFKQSSTRRLQLDLNRESFLYQTDTDTGFFDIPSKRSTVSISADKKNGLDLYYKLESDDSITGELEVKAGMTRDGFQANALVTISEDGTAVTPLSFDLKIGDECTLELQYSDFDSNSQLVPVVSVSAKLLPETMVLDASAEVNTDYYRGGKILKYRLSGKMNAGGSAYELELTGNGTLLMQGSLDMIPGKSFAESLLTGNLRLYFPAENIEFLRTLTGNQSSAEMIFEVRQNGKTLVRDGVTYLFTLGYTQIMKTGSAEKNELYGEMNGERVSLTYTMTYGRLHSFTLNVPNLLTAEYDYNKGISISYDDKFNRASLELDAYSMAASLLVLPEHFKADVSFGWADEVYALSVKKAQVSSYMDIAGSIDYRERSHSGLNATLDTNKRSLSVRLDKNGSVLGINAGVEPHRDGARLYLTADMENPAYNLYGRLMDIELDAGDFLTLRADVREPKYSGRSGSLENLFSLNAMLDPSTFQLTGWLMTEDGTCTLEGNLETLPAKDRTNGAHNAYTVVLREDGRIAASATLKLSKNLLWSLLLGDLDVTIENTHITRSTQLVTGGKLVTVTVSEKDTAVASAALKLDDRYGTFGSLLLGDLDVTVGNMRVTRAGQINDNSLSALFTVYENGETVDTITLELGRSAAQDGYTRWDAAFEDIRGQVGLGILYRLTDDGIGFGADCTLTQAGGEAEQLLDFLFELNEAAPDFAPIGGNVQEISGELAENLWKLIDELLR